MYRFGVEKAEDKNNYDLNCGLPFRMQASTSVVENNCTFISQNNSEDF